MEGIGSILSKGGYFNAIQSKRRSYFTIVPNDFITSREFTIYEKMVCIVLKKYQMSHKTCWPGIATIARCVGCGDSSVKKAIKGLVAKNVITVERDCGRRSNTYRILSKPP